MTTGTVRRKQVRDLTFKLLTEHNLEGWRVRFNPRLTRALGRCCYGTKTIEFQPRYMQQNDWEQVRGTILHEAAHAIAGHYAGHGASWARVARELGLENPSAINYTAKLTKRYTGTCPTEGCDTRAQRDRRTAGLICRLHRARIIWTRND